MEFLLVLWNLLQLLPSTAARLNHRLIYLFLIWTFRHAPSQSQIAHFLLGKSAIFAYFELHTIVALAYSKYFYVNMTCTLVFNFWCNSTVQFNRKVTQKWIFSGFLP